MQYEDFMQNKLAALQNISVAIGVPIQDYTVILQEIEAIKHQTKSEYGHYHKNHITGKPGDWASVVPPDISQEIYQRHERWMKAKGYLLPAH
jgi:hypothetical protein